MLTRNRITYYSLLTVLLTLFMNALFLPDIQAQRINLNLDGNELLMRHVSSGELNFSEAAKNSLPVLVSGSEETIHIDFTENEDLIAVIEIEGQENLDITVDIDLPSELRLEGDETESIPVELRWAYANTGGESYDIETAKTEAMEPTGGLYSATFPIVRREGGAPLPPVPPHEGGEVPTGIAYLFIYGSLGPVGSVPAGIYSDEVTIHAEYTTYD